MKIDIIKMNRFDSIKTFLQISFKIKCPTRLASDQTIDIEYSIH